MDKVCNYGNIFPLSKKCMDLEISENCLQWSRMFELGRNRKYFKAGLENIVLSKKTQYQTETLKH